MIVKVVYNDPAPDALTGEDQKKCCLYSIEEGLDKQPEIRWFTYL